MQLPTKYAKNNIKILMTISIIIFQNLAYSADKEIQDILKEYSINEARFYSKYKNKLIKKIGIVTFIGAETSIERQTNSLIGLAPMFFIGINVTGSKISCLIFDKNIAEKLNPNDKIQVAGTIDDVSNDASGLQLTNCKITIN